jgi:hypothetical protein
MKCLALLRNERFSPNSVEKDSAILMAVVDALRLENHDVTVMVEDDAPACTDCYNLVVTMGRLPETLTWLKSVSAKVVNRPEAVEICQDRALLVSQMGLLNIPLPPVETGAGYWLKRGDACAQTSDDVVFAADEAEKARLLQDFRQRGIANVVVQGHVEGDLVKFYGVRDTSFFRCFYPTDDGQCKFGVECMNGPARHYAFKVSDLCYEATRLAAHIGLDVYGGDAIVRPDGSFCVIDFNDWPSFSRCRDEAARAVASLFM